MIGCAAEQEAAWDDVLSMHGVGNVLRLVGQVSDGRDSLCDVSLWAPLSWSVQRVADTRGKDKSFSSLESLTVPVSPTQY